MLEIFKKYDRNPNKLPHTIQNQNIYIQINGTVLSQESINQLSLDQLNVIESILKKALPGAKVIEEKKRQEIT